MTTVGIVGAGVAGLHLALFLQKQGVPVTLYAERSPDEVRASRLPSTQSLLGPARARDVELGVAHWDGSGYDTRAVRLRVAGEPQLLFTGRSGPPSLFVDQRDYLPRLTEDFGARGGEIIIGQCTPEHVGRLAAGHELMVIATGRGGLAPMFPRIPERSPFQEAQRHLVGGLFRGVQLPHPCVLGYDIIPGQGELLEMQMLARGECVTAILVEAIPGGPFDEVTRLRYEEDPVVFDGALLALVRDHMPDTFARTDPAAFGALGPLDTLNGAVVPVARRGFVALPGGRFAMAIGDTYVSYDPVSGQGANAAVRAAWLLGELVTAHARAGRRFDEAFCASAEQRIWESICASVEWTNAFLLPPSPQLVSVLVAASQNQALADQFVANSNDTDRQWAILSSPEATAAFIAGFGVT